MSGEMTEELWRECPTLREAVESVHREAGRPDHISRKGVDSGKFGAGCYTVRVCRLRIQATLKSMMETSEFSVLEELLSKCGGIPRVIVEIAGSIARRRVRIKDRERYINDNFVQELETNREFALLSGLFYWVQSYFRNCPDSLKPCIFYLSIFTPKQLIRRRRLNGEEQFSNLLNQSIVQKGSSVVLGATRMVSCEVNGFFREYIVSKRMEENLVFELDGSCAPTTQRTGRHLVISESWVRDEIVYNSIDFSKLRSLTVSGKWEKFFISAGMKLLRVLDLEDALHVEYNDLKKIMKWFPRLKFLSLRGHNEICQLPSSIGDLRQLQSLDLRGTSIVTLPASVTKLEKLQYIRVGTTTPTEAPRLPVSRLSHYSRGRCHLVGIQMPQGIRKLTPLHTLGVVNVRSSGIKIFLEDLKKLTQLHKLGVSGIDKSNRKKFWSAISVHTSLESLSVQFDKNSSQGCFDGIALPQNSLRSLKLYGLGEGQLSKLMTPAVSGLSKIAKMNLEMAMLKKQDVNSLGELSELCILRLCFQELEGDELRFCTITDFYEVESYLQLKVLDITCSSVSGLPIFFGEQTMKELELLKVEWSRESSDQFSGLQNLPELKEVLLNGFPFPLFYCVLHLGGGGEVGGRRLGGGSTVPWCVGGKGGGAVPRCVGGKEAKAPAATAEVWWSQRGALRLRSSGDFVADFVGEGAATRGRGYCEGAGSEKHNVKFYEDALTDGESDEFSKEKALKDAKFDEALLKFYISNQVKQLKRRLTASLIDKFKKQKTESHEQPVFTRYSGKYFSTVAKSLTPQLLRSNFIPVTKDTVRNILEIPNSGLEVVPDREAGRSFILSHFNVTSIPQVSYFGKKLKSEEDLSDKDILICFMVVMFQSFLCPNSSLQPSIEYLHLFRDVANIMKYDLCKFVYDWLVSSIKKFRKAVKVSAKRQITLGGNHYILVVAYLDRVDFGLKSLPEVVPRVLVWKGSRIRDYADLDKCSENSFGKRPLKHVSYASEVQTKEPQYSQSRLPDLHKSSGRRQFKHVSYASRVQTVRIFSFRYSNCTTIFH
ncbi:uncharacterized protein LOC124655635 [Lolium rigidum]|uniref:uncharacterized protein LOC124655635 n=1 Tax=Lolium rigidum TaxID=89674 RepID=UPI001F5CC0B5|nr:uncharacterized protein LOC124655635 [Lolium rigidum]